MLCKIFSVARTRNMSTESSSTVTKVAIAATLALGAAAVVAFLMKRESKKTPKQVSADEVTREELLQILNEIQLAHDKMKIVTKQLSSEILGNNLNFDQTYQKVLNTQPVDPLDKYGLSMADFDRLLEREQHDPAVRQSLAKLMAAPEPETMATSRELSVGQILDIHRFILAELQAVISEVQALRVGKYDAKTVMIAAQAIVAARVERKFGASGDDVEAATAKLALALNGNAEFNNVNLQIQHVMTQLMTVAEQKHN
jgi:hypothetical protein